MSCRLQTLISALLVLLVSSKVTAQSPVKLSKLNPHYFEYKGTPVVLITSAEHYGAVLNLDFDYKAYLSELKSHEMNLTRTFTGVYCEPPGAFKIEKNTLAPLPGKFIAPWARSVQTGYRNGGNKFDLTRWDDKYFARLKEFMTSAAEKDIIVELTLFCPFYEDTMWIFSPLHPGNNINATPDVPRTDVYTLDKSGELLGIQKALVRKMVTELNNYDNLIFEICNEPYFGGVTMEWQHEIADLIAETEKGLPKKHLISQNIANGSSVITNPHPAVSVFNFHYAYPPNTVHQNYNLNKVIGDNETGFRGTSDSTYRFEGWRFILAGGGLYNNLDYSFTAGHENGSFEYPPTQPGGGSDSLRMQLRLLKEFITSFNFTSLAPDTMVVDTSHGDSFRYNALSDKGREYGVYMIGNRNPTIVLKIPDGNYIVTWIDPVNGNASRALKVTSRSGKLELNIPPHAADIALKIKRDT
jgi:hypothetical protein